MGRANYADALSDFRRLSEETPLDAIEILERIILDHEPQNINEIPGMLEVLIPDVEAGGRSDGRDVRALWRIHGYLSSEEVTLVAGAIRLPSPENSLLDCLADRESSGCAPGIGCGRLGRTGRFQSGLRYRAHAFPCVISTDAATGASNGP